MTSWNDVFWFEVKWEVTREIATDDWPKETQKDINNNENKLILLKDFKLMVFSIFWLIFTLCCFVLVYPISLVIWTVDFEMVSTKKKKQQQEAF